jgi:hypothetical protein
VRITTTDGMTCSTVSAISELNAFATPGEAAGSRAAAVIVATAIHRKRRDCVIFDLLTHWVFRSTRPYDKTPPVFVE